MLLWWGLALRDLGTVVIHPVGKHSGGSGQEAGPLTGARTGDGDRGQGLNGASSKSLCHRSRGFRKDAPSRTGRDTKHDTEDNVLEHFSVGL